MPRSESSPGLTERFFSLYRLAEKSGLLAFPGVLQAFYLLSYRWDDYIAKKLYEMIAHADGDHLMGDPVFSQPRDPSLVSGDVSFANTMGNGLDFGLRIDELDRLMVINGIPGAGKTYIALMITEQCIKAGIPVWIIDPKGDGYSSLIGLGSVQVFPIDEVVFNVLSPPKNVTVSEWTEVLVEVFAEMSLLTASKTVVFKCLKGVYSSWDGSEENCPTLVDFLEHLNAKFRLAKPYSEERKRLEIVRGRVELLINSLENSVKHPRGFLHKLVNENCVFQIQNKMTEIQSFVSLFLLLYLYQYKTHNDESQGRHLCICDEAQHAVFSSFRENQSGRTSSPYISTLTAQIRHSRICLVVLSQNFSKLIKELRSDSYTVITLSTASEEVFALSNSMGLNQEQRSRLYRLDVREAIVKMQGRILEPFLIRIKDCNIQPVSNDEVKRLMAPKIADLTAEIIQEKGTSPYRLIDGLDKNELYFMHTWWMNPFSTLTELYDLLSPKVAKSTAAEIKTRLVEHKIMKEYSVLSGKQGGEAKILGVDSVGRIWGKRYYQDESPCRMLKGSNMVTMYYIDKVCSYYRNRNYKVTVGDMRCGKEVDIGMITPERLKIAVELTKHESNIISHIQSNLSSKFYDELYFIIIDETAEKRIKENIFKKVDVQLQKRIKIYPIKQYL